MLKYNQGRFEIGRLSFAVPDGMYLTTSPDIELTVGLTLLSEDKRIRLTVGLNGIAECAKESIESIFDEADRCRMLGTVTKLSLHSLVGYGVLYETEAALHAEACLDTPAIDGACTLTVWTCTEKAYGKDAAARMQALHTEVLNSIRME